MREPVWIQSNHLQLARQGVYLVRMAPTQHQSDYIPLYTADAIREAVEAEREACAKLAENTVCDVHLPTGIRIYGYVAARAIRARGAA